MSNFAGKGKPISPEEERTIKYLLSGDPTSAFQNLRSRPRPEREAIIIGLAKNIISGEIEIADGKGDIKKAILHPNSMIGILKVVSIPEETRNQLADLFIVYCKK